MKPKSIPQVTVPLHTPETGKAASRVGTKADDGVTKTKKGGATAKTRDAFQPRSQAQRLAAKHIGSVATNDASTKRPTRGDFSREPLRKEYDAPVDERRGQKPAQSNALTLANDLKALRTQLEAVQPASWKGQERHITAATLSDDETKLLVGTANGIVGVWDLKAQKMVGRPVALDGYLDIRAVTFTPDGKKALVVERVNMSMVDLQTGSNTHLGSSLGVKTQPLFSPDGRAIAFGGEIDADAYVHTNDVWVSIRSLERRSAKHFVGDFKGKLEHISFATPTTLQVTTRLNDGHTRLHTLTFPSVGASERAAAARKELTKLAKHTGPARFSLGSHDIDVPERLVKPLARHLGALAKEDPAKWELTTGQLGEFLAPAPTREARYKALSDALVTVEETSQKDTVSVAKAWPDLSRRLAIAEELEQDFPVAKTNTKELLTKLGKVLTPAQRKFFSDYLEAADVDKYDTVRDLRWLFERPADDSEPAKALLLELGYLPDASFALIVEQLAAVEGEVVTWRSGTPVFVANPLSHVLSKTRLIEITNISNALITSLQEAPAHPPAKRGVPSSPKASPGSELAVAFDALSLGQKVDVLQHVAKGISHTDMQGLMRKGHKVLPEKAAKQFLALVESKKGTTETFDGHDIPFEDALVRVHDGTVLGYQLVYYQAERKTDRKAFIYYDRDFNVLTTNQFKDTYLCTELVRQGLLPANAYEAAATFGADYRSMPAMIGYGLWAKPLVRCMRRSTIITAMVAPFVICWAFHMAYVQGKHAQDNWLGRWFFKVGLPLNGLFGQAVVGARRIQTRSLVSPEYVRSA